MSMSKSPVIRWRGLVQLVSLLKLTYPSVIVANTVLTLLVGVVPLLPLFTLQRVVDEGTAALGRDNNSLPRSVLLWVAAFTLAMVLQNTISELAAYVRLYLQERLKTCVQERVITKAQSVPLLVFEQATFYDQLKRIEAGLDQRFMTTMDSFFALSTNAVTLISMVWVFWGVHWSLPVVAAGCTSVFVLVRVRRMREQFLLDRRQTPGQRRLEYLAELMTKRPAAAEVRLFSLGKYLLTVWERVFAVLSAERLRTQHRQFRFSIISNSGQAFSLGLVLVLLLYFMIRNHVTPGQYAGLVWAVQQFQAHLFNFVWRFVLINHDLRYIEDFADYMALPSEPLGHMEIQQGRKPPAEIVFDNVSFAYPGSQEWAIHKINLKIRCGERIALVGENGAGKTTLVRLLLGLIPPTAGRIIVDGVPLQELDLAQWRRGCSAIFQDFQQYHVSVRDNIAFGDVAAATDLARIQAAGEKAGFDSIAAKLPRGYDTQLGKEFEGGVDLSGGEWQRLALTRAYVRDAGVMVLDEPAASLDAKVEMDLYRQFRDVSEGRTVILVSHRLGSARLANRILVIQNGKLVEEGAHSDLMDQDGYYAAMFRAQSAWYV